MGFDRVIRLENVSKQYGGKPVIDGLSLLIEDGELVCVTGPSGVGKSTLLHLIAGLVPPDGGVVEVSAEPIGYVFQEPRLLPWCDVRDNVQVGLYAQRLGRDERRLLVEDVLARVGLAGSGHLYPAQLSGGMKQRVALARAFVVRPRVLLLDEPFSALDYDLRRSLREYLVELLSWRPCTTVFVTHDLEDAVRLGDRIVALRDQPVTSQVEHRIDSDRADRGEAFCTAELAKFRALSGPEQTAAGL